MKGYIERTYKAVEIAGGKVKREKSAPQGPEVLQSAMMAWVSATRHLGAKAEPR